MLLSVGLEAQNNTLYEKAIEAKENKDYKKAAVLFEKYLSKIDTINPSHETLLTMSSLAEVYRELKDGKKAIAIVDQIIKTANDTLDYKAKDDAYQIKISYLIFGKNKFRELTNTLLKSAELSHLNNNRVAEFSAYQTLAFNYTESSFDTTLFYLKKLKPLARTNNEFRIFHSIKARVIESEAIDSARHHYKESIRYAHLTNDSIYIATAYRDYSNFLSSSGQFENALEYSLKSLDYFDNSRMGSYRKINTLTKITETYKDLGDFNMAEKYIQQASDLATKHNFRIQNTEVARLQGEVYFGQQRFDEAIIELEKAEAAYSKTNKTYIQLGTTSALSLAYYKANQTAKAFEYLNKMESRIKEVKENPKLYLRHQLQCGMIYKDQNNLALALKHFEEAKKTSKELNQDVSTLKVCSNLGEIYKNLNNPTQASLNFEEAFLLREKAFKNDMIENTKKIEAIYQKAEQDKEIIELNANNLTQEIQLNQKTKLLTIGGIALGIISLLTFFIFGLYRKVKQKNAIIASSLNEKDILLREIHHRVKNNLQVISSLLSLQSRQIEDKEIKQAINEGRSRVRSMALIHQNLYQKENLTGVSVEEYINKLTEELFDTYNITENQIVLTKSIQDIELDVETMVPLGLIINELVSNSLKHAFPNNRNGLLHVSLSEKNNKILLTIQDNGIGTTLDEMNASNSFGNRLIKAFSNKLDADISIQNENGTTVSIIVKRYKKAA